MDLKNISTLLGQLYERVWTLTRPRNYHDIIDLFQWYRLYDNLLAYSFNPIYRSNYLKRQWNTGKHWFEVVLMSTQDRPSHINDF